MGPRRRGAETARRDGRPPSPHGDSTFFPLGVLPTHMIEAATEMEYECAACGKTFDSEDALERHLHDVGLVD